MNDTLATRSHVSVPQPASPSGESDAGVGYSEDEEEEESDVINADAQTERIRLLLEDAREKIVALTKVRQAVFRNSLFIY